MKILFVLVCVALPYFCASKENCTTAKSKAHEPDAKCFLLENAAKDCQKKCQYCKGNPEVLECEEKGFKQCCCLKCETLTKRHSGYADEVAGRGGPVGGRDESSYRGNKIKQKYGRRQYRNAIARSENESTSSSNDDDDDKSTVVKKSNKKKSDVNESNDESSEESTEETLEEEMEEIKETKHSEKRKESTREMTKSVEGKLSDISEDIELGEANGGKISKNVTLNEESKQDGDKNKSNLNLHDTTTDNSCRENILKKYPEAQCTRAKDKDVCRKQCETKGNEHCKGQQGEIHKLNCKDEKSVGGSGITCCCSIKCESAEDTKSRLNEEFDREVGVTSGICAEMSRDEIKQKMKELCKTEDRVFIARKYCMEEKNGQYFCVKDGKCLGKACKGCIKHECEVEGIKELANPPPEYMEKHLKLKDFNKNVAVNIDDMKNTEKIQQWCTMTKDRKQCPTLCKNFGDRMCGAGKALKYDHDDFCKRDEKECKCCCQPVCKGRSIT